MGPTLVAFPGLEVRRSRGSVKLHNPVLGLEIEASGDLLALLECFERPRALSSFLQEYDVDPAVLEMLRRTLVLVDVQELPFLRAGFVEPARDPIGLACPLNELGERAVSGAFAVFGLPIDAGATGLAGARAGPAEIRRHFPCRLHDDGEWVTALLDVSFRREVNTRGLRVLDLGDVLYSPGEDIAVAGQRVTKLLDQILEHDMVPVLLGGDHSVSWFVLQTLLPRNERLSVVHLDAHHDLYPSRVPRLHHGNPFTYALERPSLVRLLQLGVRTLEVKPKRTRQILDRRIRWHSARELGRMTPAEALQSLPREVPCYLSFDVDCLDPGVAPETGYWSPGGLSLDRALELVDHLARDHRVVGADFVEVSQAQGPRNAAAAAAARVAAQLMLGSCPTKPLRSYYRRYR